MNTWKILAPISAIVIVTAVGCATGTEDDGSANNSAFTATVAVDTDARCVAIRDLTDSDAQAKAADDLEDADPAAYETCRKSLSANASSIDEFLKWATAEELEADATEDPTEAAPSTPRTPKGTVNVTVSIAKQRADIVGGALNFENVQVATGRPGYGTVRGCHDGFAAERNHWSRKYHAPMPYTVFFYKGEALHQGDVHVRSHGCVHLSKQHAAAVYNAYREGYTVHVCVN